MLNRRSLRIKGMQSIFAFQIANEADYNICKKKAHDAFLPDLNSMEYQDKEALKTARKEAELFYDYKRQSQTPEEVPIDELIPSVVDRNYNEYLNKIEDNRRMVKKRMLSDLTKLKSDYIKLLVLPIAIEKFISDQKTKKNIQGNNFASNQVLAKLKESESIEMERARKNIAWNTETIRSWSKDVLNKSEFYLVYEELEKSSFEDDKQFILAFFKKLVFKNETMIQYFESTDISWAENGSILKSMVLKTIKSLETNEDEPVLIELSRNWEDDLEFVTDLYEETITEDKKLEDLIESKTKNWKIDRITQMDKIILKMAMTEMMTCPSIPVKVTINEYIELSKNYSTPKSKQFINGLLDVLSVDLQSQGLIRKSGRGLLDNK